MDWTPPWVRWFDGGQLNASYNCLDRHVEAGGGDKVAFHWEGEPGDTPHDHVRGPARRGVPARERPAVARRRQGRPREHLPRAWCPSCRSRCSRARGSAPRTRSCSAASAPRRCATGSTTPQAKVLITADGAWRRGTVVPLKDNADEALARVSDDRARDHGPAVRQRARLHRGSRPLVPRARRRTSPPSASPSRWTPRTCSTCCTRAARPGKPKGIAHTTGGYMTQVAATHRMIFDIHEDDVYWCAADCGWVTGHSYIVYGPLANHTTGVMYEGAPDWPDKDRWWAIVERYGVTILYTAPTAIRAFMRWGTEYPAAARPVVAAAAGFGRRADQPRGVDLVLEGDRHRAVPDRRHLVADRDRRDHDHAAARAHHAQAGVGDPAVPRHRGRRRRRGAATSVRPRRRGLPRAAASVAAIARTIWGDPDRYVADLLLAVRARGLRGGRRCQPRRRRLLLAARPDRRRDERRGPPALDLRDRVGPGRRRQGRRGGGGVEAARHQG